MTAAAGASSVGLAEIGAAGGPLAASSAAEVWTVRVQSAIKKSREIRGGNYVQIATVDADGAPRCRTVVFRGFQSLEGTPVQAMRMITDARSEKVGHVQRSPACELVWWFPASSEQYRVAGELQLVGPDASGELQGARQEQWQKLSDPAREQFWWPSPGIDYSGQPTVPKGGRGENGEVLPPPEAFLLALLWPRQVKYLRLGDNLALLDVLDAASGTWHVSRVNP